MLNNKENGNAAAMRDSLGMVLRYLQWLYAQGCTDRGRLSDEIDRVVSAINEPTRNCDIGTAEEQAERFIDYCCGKCDGSNCKHGLYREDELYKCVIKWEQMPYGREDDNDQKSETEKLRNLVKTLRQMAIDARNEFQSFSSTLPKKDKENIHRSKCLMLLVRMNVEAQWGLFKDEKE